MAWASDAAIARLSCTAWFYALSGWLARPGLVPLVADITQDGAAESAVNLASELASFMVGSVVMADGGMTVTAG